METKTDESFGVIPYICEGDTPLFLIVHQFSHWRGDSYWVFPKGHSEKGESPVQTATRELFEETGVQLKSVDTKHPFVITYDFHVDDTLIKKTVTFFLGEATSKKLTLQENEVNDACWCEYETAYEKITHQSTRDVLGKAKYYV